MNAKKRLSVCTDDLRLDIKSALRAASQIGFRAVDIGAAGAGLNLVAGLVFAAPALSARPARILREAAG